ncbi:putative P-type conjugative transfer protein TrbL [Thiomonas sp. X19]|uniref:P-type conjugative transfer protein TrbL n=1 Tax=Thiomonas sp. X19 TaxID=1050370 RepID=UPI000B716453|nr:P-type conjugative transfer protein TrbL [Thiomonas sp. X19]SCC93195.1 putative P-type conjugative transfer protein TrbL [Thiomonas sp. X19]
MKVIRVATGLQFGSCLLLLAVMVSSPSAHAAGVLDTIQSSMQAASTGWMRIAEGYAKTIFAALAVFELVWSGAQYTLQKNDLSDFMVAVLFKVSALAFFYTLMLEASTWMPLVIQSFTTMGQTISGTPPLTPSGVFDQGVNLATRIITAVSNAQYGLTEIGQALLADIVVGLTGFIVVIAYALIALQFLMTLIESYIVLGGGAVMLGFMGSRWTANWGEKYFGYAVSVGVKLLVVYLIVGFGTTLTAQELALLKARLDAHGVPPLSNLLDIGLSALVFGGVAWNVPGLAGSFMNGTPSMSLGNMAAPMAGISAGVIAAGAAATGGLARLATLTQGSAGGGLPLGVGGGGVGGGGVGDGGTAGTPGAVGSVGGMDRLAALGSMTGAAGQGAADLARGNPSGGGSTAAWNAGPAQTPRAAIPALPSSMANAQTFSNPPMDPPQSTNPQQVGADQGSGAQATASRTSDLVPPASGNADTVGAPTAGAGAAGDRAQAGASSSLDRLAARMGQIQDNAAGRALQHVTGHDGNAGGLTIRLVHPD